MDDSQSLIRNVLGDKYEIKDLIQSGGMGKIFLGIHKALGRKVAIKIIHQELVKNEDFKRRFCREARLAASLDHPGIIDIYDFGSEDDFDYIIMPFIEGETLQACIKRQGPLGVSEGIELTIKIADALNYAHQHNVYHRDIKSSNIMFDNQGKVIITDFGISKQLDDDDLTAPNAVLGSPRYMSPEQIRGRPVDARSDLYSLGLVFYEMVTGRHPFHGKDTTSLYYAQAHEIPPRPETSVSDIPRPVGSIIMRLLEKTPEKRYPDGDALINDLQYYQRGKISTQGKKGDATIADSAIYYENEATIADNAALVNGTTPMNKAKSPGSHPEVPPEKASPKGRPKADGFLKRNKKALPIGGVVLVMFLVLLTVLSRESPTDKTDFPKDAPQTERPVTETPLEVKPDAFPEDRKAGLTDPTPDMPSVVTPEILFKRLLTIGNGKKADNFNVWTDRESYRIGQTIQFQFEAEDPCYAVIVAYTTANQFIKVFPNYYRSSPFVQPGRKYEIPDERMGFDLQVTGPAGTDTVIALVSDSPFELFESSFSENRPFALIDEKDTSKLADIFERVDTMQHRDIYNRQVTYAIQ